MLNIIGRKNFYFLISLLVIVPGLISLFLLGLRLSIDFTGGTRMTLLFPKVVNQQTVDKVKTVFTTEKAEIVTIQRSENRVILRTKPLSEKKDAVLLDKLKKSVGTLKQEEFETIGPTIGKE